MLRRLPSGQTALSPDEMTGCSLDELVVDYELFERGVQGVGYVEQPFRDELSLSIFESPVALSVHS